MAERSFFRIVKANPPGRRDILSNQGRRGEFPPHLPSHLRRLWDGISVHDSLDHARRQARETPWLGSYVAEIKVPDGASARIRWERTILNNAGHHTLWGDPDDLLGFVVAVVPV